MPLINLYQLLQVVSICGFAVNAFGPTQFYNGQGKRHLSHPLPARALSDEAEILLKAVQENRRKNPETIIAALRALELDERERAKSDPTVAAALRDSLRGEWQFIFVTDKRLKSVIYLPVNNILSIRDVFENDKQMDLLEVENAICVGPNRWTALSFVGTMEWDERKRQGIFDYDHFTAFNRAINIKLKPGQAGSLVRTVEKRGQSTTKPFFQFFLADEDLAAARGSVGGFALWKRVTG